MRIIFLGTNGWYDTVSGNTICIFIEGFNYNIVFDAGSGFHKLNRYISEEKPLYIFLSHFHLDHIIGLHTLSKFMFNQGIIISGPSGIKGYLNTIINKPYTLPLSEFPFQIDIIELPEEQHKLPFYVKTKSLLHSSLTVGYRIELDGKVITYCPDTGYCQNAVELSHNADLFIADCAYKSGQRNEQWPHLNPETAAKIADEANCKKLALVHFDANLYRTFQDRKDAEKSARNIFDNTFSAYDDMEVVV